MQSLRVSDKLFKGFTHFTKQFRFSVNTYSGSHEKLINLVFVDYPSEKKWPNQKLGPIDAINPKYPFPGSVGISTQAEAVARPKPFVPAVRTLPNVREDHYANILIEAHNNQEQTLPLVPLVPKPSETLECRVVSCPTLVKQDLSTLFLDRKVAPAAPLTAIILTHRTDISVSSWSEQAANERETLANSFIESAIDICASLKEMGYWTDFINPFTGKPYLGKHSDASLTETDEKMTHFGFEVDDLGCCKVLRHPRWNHDVFVGFIFTDAPRDHPVLLHI